MRASYVYRFSNLLGYTVFLNTLLTLLILIWLCVKRKDLWLLSNTTSRDTVDVTTSTTSHISRMLQYLAILMAIMGLLHLASAWTLLFALYHSEHNNKPISVRIRGFVLATLPCLSYLITAVWFWKASAVNSRTSGTSYEDEEGVLSPTSYTVLPAETETTFGHGVDAPTVTTSTSAF